MFGLVGASVSLDVGTLCVIAICVTFLLGLFLLFAWMQERIQALAWWGLAYLIGGFSGTLWRFGDVIAPFLPPSIADMLLLIAVGMIWSAARLFHGRPVRWGTMSLGATIWLIACFSPVFVHSPAGRIVMSSLIVASYTFLSAAELSRERRKSLIRRWPAIFVPMLHGVIFLSPVALATLSPSGSNMNGPATSWIALFAIEIVLYVVGGAFVALVLAKDRTVRFYKMAAATDPLTALLNRRGFFEAAEQLMATAGSAKTPVSVLAFDIDHFKSINDRFGHGVGDIMLQLFATVVRKSMRTDDIIGRLGGEEFVAILPSTLAEATMAAERVRTAFAATSAESEGQYVPATVSIGVACGSAFAPIDTLIARSDAALYRAKTNGRNRVETADEALGATPDRPAETGLAAISRKFPALRLARV